MARAVTSSDELAALLRQMRREAGLTQIELAASIGIHQPQVSAVESGKQLPKTDMLIPWIQACGGRLDVLLPSEVADENRMAGPLQQRVRELEPRLTDQERLLLEVQLDVITGKIRVPRQE